MSVNNTPAWPWHSVPDVVAQSVESRLCSELRAGKVFLLVDPIAGVDDFDAFMDLPQFPLDAASLRLQQKHTPFLLALPDRHDASLMRSVHIAILEQLKLYRHGKGVLRVGGWLQHVDQDGQALAEQLTRLFQLERPRMGVSWLRLADRRVLEMLHRGQKQSRPALLPLMDWPSLLGESIPCWSYLDRNFTVRTLHGKPGKPSGNHLSFPAPYWQLLGRSTTLSELLTRWHGRQHPLPEDAMGQVLLMLRRLEREHPDWASERIVADANARLVAGKP